MIRRPMKPAKKSVTDDQLNLLAYPLAVFPKIDGLRCVIDNAKALTSKLKDIPNDYIREYLSNPDLEGLDGELTVGPRNAKNVFKRSTSGVRRKTGRPKFFYHVFDLRWQEEDFNKRANTLVRYKHLLKKYDRVKFLTSTICYTPQEVKAFLELCLSKGYEGIIIRRLNALYKFGRSTLREEGMLRIKPVEDTEATIIGFYEQNRNDNEQKTTELGLNKRSSHQANKTGKGTLGGFILSSSVWGEFRCGTGEGITHQLRQEIWDNKDRYLGRLVTFKYQLTGSQEKPRSPIFKGFRDDYDMTDY